MCYIRTVRVHQIEAEKEGYGCQGVGASIQTSLAGNGNNEELFHQAKCASIFTYIPAKIPWTVLRASDAIHEVHPYAKAVPADQRIVSSGKYLKSFKGNDLIIKEEVDTKADDTGVQSDLWGRWVNLSPV